MPNGTYSLYSDTVADMEAHFDENNCSLVLPSTADLFGVGFTAAGAVVLALSFLFTVATICVYIEQLIYLFRHWAPSDRRNSTFFLLSLYPFISFSSFLSIVVPRSGVLVDLLHNAFIACCLEAFMRLLESYYLSPEHMLKALSKSTINLRGPPCCCCCFCLPSVSVNRTNYSRVRWLVLQAAIVRPFLMLIAAVLWANGTYQAGVMAFTEAYSYITVLNICTTLPAVWGLVMLVDLTQTMLPVLNIKIKLCHIQLVLVATSLFSLLCSLLVRYDVIPCSTVLSSESRGERLYHLILIAMMLPLGIMARFYFLKNDTELLHSMEEVTPPDSAGNELADDNDISFMFEGPIENINSGRQAPNPVV